MEITEKFNLKTKALVIILIATIMVAMSTLLCTVKAAEEPKLNTKIEFTGNTYKLPNKDKVRKPYDEGEVGCGIVSIISRNAKHPVYVTGEGWIDIEQIVKSEKFIDLNFDNIKNGEFTLTVNGEFINVESINKTVLDYENGNLKIVGDGTTNVIITKKDGEQIDALATVVGGELTLSIPGKSLTGEVSAVADIAEKITVTANGAGGASLVIGEDGIGVAGAAGGDILVEADGVEPPIVSAEGMVTGEATGNAGGITADFTGEQSMTLLEKLTLRIRERLGMHVNAKDAGAYAGGDLEVNDNEIATGDASINYVYEEDEATVEANANVMEQDINPQPLKFKVVETLKNLGKMLMGKIGAR